MHVTSDLSPWADGQFPCSEASGLFNDITEGFTSAARHSVKEPCRLAYDPFICSDVGIAMLRPKDRILGVPSMDDQTRGLG